MLTELTLEDLARDLAADLAIRPSSMDGFAWGRLAGKGWPAALRRAIAAERERDRLREACRNAAALLRRLGGHNHDPEYSELLAALGEP